MGSGPQIRAKLLTGAAMAVLGCLVSAQSAQAIEYKVGEVELFLDTTLSYGASWRVQDADCTNVSTVNGGCRYGNKLPDFGNPIPGGGLKTGTRSTNTDDGTQNFGVGDLVASTFKITADFEARWRNFGLFVRGLAFHDTVYDRNNLDFRDLHPAARDDLANDVRLLDAFLSTNFTVGDIPVTLRVGNQVINWGESLLIQGGINSYLPVDVARLRTPGAEIKEALLPVPAVYASVGVIPGLDVQGFYQWKHVDSEVDPARSFYSVADFAGAGGRFIVSGGADDPATAPIVQRRFTDQGKDDGAFGVGVTYYADWLNNGTELQGYYVNFSSPLPYLTFQAPPINFETACNTLAGLGAIPDGFNGGPDSCVQDPNTHAPTAFGFAAGQARYGFDFPDDIEIFGLSFNTQLFGAAVAGEVAYWPDLPLALTDGEINAQIIDADDSSIPSGEILRAPLVLNAYINNGGLGAIAAGTAAIASEAGTSWAVGAPTGGAGDIFQAFHREDAITGQVSAIKTFSSSHILARWLGANQTAAILNGGFMWVPDLPDKDEAVISAAGCEVGHPNLTPSLAIASGSSAKTNVKCASKVSAGYRAVVSTTYNNVANTAWTLSPSVGFRHDFQGRSPGPFGPGFVAGQGQVSVGVTADLQSKWRARVEYLNFYGAGFRNPRNDRDTISVNLSYSF